MTQLPLFPLGSVLFPGLVMPLHIFERRYRVLVEALMALPDDAPREFGVVALRNGREVGPGPGQLHAVGCTAVLREVTPYDDGRFDILAVGRTRFALESVDGSGETPYLTGQVRLLPEPDGDADLELDRDRVVRLFLRYRELVGGRTIAMPAPEPGSEEEAAAARESAPDEGAAAIPDDPGVVSYLVAAATTLDLPTRQSLLEEPNTALRLRAEARLLRSEIGLIRAFNALPDVGAADGAFTPN